MFGVNLVIWAKLTPNLGYLFTYVCHSIAEQHGLPVSLSTSTGLSCQQGGISDDSKNYIPVLELGKLPEVRMKFVDSEIVHLQCH